VRPLKHWGHFAAFPQSTENPSNATGFGYPSRLLLLPPLLQPSGGFNDAVLSLSLSLRSISDTVLRRHDDRVVTYISAGSCRGANAEAASSSIF